MVLPPQCHDTLMFAAGLMRMSHMLLEERSLQTRRGSRANKQSMHTFREMTAADKAETLRTLRARLVHTYHGRLYLPQFVATNALKCEKRRSVSEGVL